jgi:hypothetical protein
LRFREPQSTQSLLTIGCAFANVPIIPQLFSQTFPVVNGSRVADKISILITTSALNRNNQEKIMTGNTSKEKKRSLRFTQVREWVSLTMVMLLLLLGAIPSIHASDRVTFPAGVSDGGFPGYAQLGYDPLLQALFIINDGEWAAIPFYRDPACVPADFNLIDQVDVPRAFGCASTVEGYLILPATGTDFHFHAQGPVDGFPLPTVYFVKYAELLAATADGYLSIGELQALPSLKIGRATFFQDNSGASFTDVSYLHFHANFRAEGFLVGDPNYSSFLMHLSAAGEGQKSSKTFLNPPLTEIRFGK